MVKLLSIMSNIHAKLQQMQKQKLQPQALLMLNSVTLSHTQSKLQLKVVPPDLVHLPSRPLPSLLLSVLSPTCEMEREDLIIIFIGHHTKMWSPNKH